MLCFRLWRKRRGGKYIEEGVGGATTSFSSFPFKKHLLFFLLLLLPLFDLALPHDHDEMLVLSEKGLCGSHMLLLFVCFLVFYFL